MAELTAAEKLREIVRDQIDHLHKFGRSALLDKDYALMIATLVRASAELTAEEDARHDAEIAEVADEFESSTVEDLLNQAAAEPRS